MKPYVDTAELYEQRVAPRYRPIAQLVADRVRITGASAVLEVAAGTGLLTRLLADRGARCYIATDASLAMLDVARIHVPTPPVRFAVADAAALPTDDGAVDVVVSSLGPIQESVALLRESRRVLAAGGQLVFVQWGEDYAEKRLLARVRDRIGAEPQPETSTEALVDRAHEAGFDEVVATTVRLPAVHDSVPAYLDYRSAFGALPWMEPFERTLGLIGEEAAAFTDRSGRVQLDWAVTVLEARAA